MRLVYIREYHAVYLPMCNRSPIEDIHLVYIHEYHAEYLPIPWEQYLWEQCFRANSVTGKIGETQVRYW